MIPTYHDSEIKCFHPIVEKSLNKALEALGVSDKYVVKHHDYVSNVEVDFVIKNKETQKSLCVIEVKRTPAAVKSQRYQVQAKSYVDLMPTSQIEKPYFILTNIEFSYLFKSDKNITQVYKQIVKPGLISNVMFNEVQSDTELIKRSTEHYKALLQVVLNDSGVYDNGINDIIEQISSSKDDYEVWKSNFAKVAYEYIRGAFSTLHNGINIKDIRQYQQHIDSIREVFKRIDFDGIFNCPKYADTPKLSNDILSSTFNLGKTETDADELVSTLHSIISERHHQEGEVPTDIELAHLMLVIAKKYCPKINGYVCDPAAGSGNLISCVSEVYEDIKPCQIKANDYKPQLLQLLSLRLGLKFAHSIKPDNAPQISAENVINLPMQYFNDIDLILLNPPMVSGVTDPIRKQEFYNNIPNAKTNIGQVPLECAFLEYINSKIKDGTVTVTLMPKTHLTASGDFAVALRKFLLEDFGLCLVFDYPSAGIFKGVAKATVMLVGRKNTKCEEVASLSSIVPIPDITPDTINRLLDNGIDNDSIDGIEYRKTAYKELENTIGNGWRSFNSIMAEANTFIKNKLLSSKYMRKVRDDCGLNISRGKVGNNGLTNILFLNTNKNYANIQSQVKDKLCAGMHNAKYEELKVGKGDSRFFNIRNFTPQERNEIISMSLRAKVAESKQQRKQKSKAEIHKILDTESKNSCTPANTILIPRNLRTSGRIYRCTEETFVSTNFFTIQGLSEEESMLTSSWMSTIFYQICCERYCKNQDGTRKMEKKEISETLIPDTANIPKEDKERILKQGIFEEFVILKKPKIRSVDKVWAKTLFGDKWEETLDEAKDLLTRLANARYVERIS